MNRLDQIISDITYVRSCLNLLKDIQESGCCNDCHKKKYCKYKPKWGELAGKIQLPVLRGDDGMIDKDAIMRFSTMGCYKE